MARPTYIDIPDTDVDLDSPGKEDLVFKRLRDNINAMRIQIIKTDVAEQTETGSSFVTKATIRIFLPNVANYAGIARRIVAEIDVKVNNGANTGTYRLRDSASGDVSNEVTTTATSYEQKSPILTVDPAWLSGDGVVRLIQIQAKVSAGTAYVKADERASWFQEY